MRKISILSLLLVFTSACQLQALAPAPWKQTAAVLPLATAANLASTAESPLPALPPLSSSPAFITFVINVHDWVHAGESAEILLKLVDLFERYQARGDFYFTPEITRQLEENFPEVIERFRGSKMTISYHVRPPHPLYPGFDARLKELEDRQLEQTLLDYETYALDLTTGELDRSRPGGYSYVAQVFGRKPVVASAPSNDRRLKAAAQKVYASLGARMAVLYHEEGTKIDRSFEYFQGLLVRPSDFSVTRTTLIDGTDNFWWNFMSRPQAEQYDPVALLQRQLADWQSKAYPRPPFITALIHENNFYRAGPEAWTSIYYQVEQGRRGAPLSPPYHLDAPDPSRPRSKADKDAIWAAYERLVAYASANLSVVTSEDIVRLAKPVAPASLPPPGGKCGDQVCDAAEQANPNLCPQDCVAVNPPPESPAGTPPAPQGGSHWVTNPSSGAKLYVEVLHPTGWDGQPLPAFVLVPGGNGGAQSFKRGVHSAQLLADQGFIVVLFDPDGRGRSEGSEDQNGFIHQDGLAAVIRYAAALPVVDAGQVGLGSFSYGGTMAAGALARYPDLPVRFFIDWEGPADRTDTGGCDQAQTGHLLGKVSCDDEAYWSQREEVNFIGQIQVPFLRLQTELDHVQPDGLHSLKVVNAAVQGGVPWVRLNDDPPNQLYDLAAPPAFLPETFDRMLMELFAKYAYELLGK